MDHHVSYFNKYSPNFPVQYNRGHIVLQVLRNAVSMQWMICSNNFFELFFK